MKRFYVTIIRHPGPNQRVGWLLGPYDTQDEAQGHVDRAKVMACKADPFATFDAFGVSSVEGDKVAKTVFGV